MKVLFVCSQNNKDFEVSPFIQSQANSLKEKGVQIDIFIVKINKWKGVISNVSKIKKIKKDYDIIHAHYSTNGLISILAGAYNKLIISYLGSDLLGINNSDGTKRKISKLIQFISFIVSIFSKAIIVKSEQMRTRILSRYSDKTTVIPNGVNFEVFKPGNQAEAINKLGLCSDKKNLLFLGNKKDANKNLALAKQAFKLLPTNKYNLVTPYPVIPADVPIYLNAADVLLLTSLSEGSANVIKEALACNTPIVSVNAGDVSENIKNVCKSYLVDYDPEQIATKITEACQDNDRSDGRSKILHLEISNIADRIITVYKTITNV